MSDLTSGTATGRSRRRVGGRRQVAAAALAVCALVLAACGSAPSSSGSGTPAPGTSAAGSSAPSAPAGSSSAAPSVPAASSGAGSSVPAASGASGASPSAAGSSSVSPSATAPVVADFGNACMVTDVGGIDDRSFNAASWQGVQDATKALNIKSQLLQSTAESDYVPNISTFVNGKCGLIVTVGALMTDATQSAAQKYPKQDFAIVDVTYPKTIPNVRGLAFDTSQSAFLAGYLAAGMSKSGKVAEFGGLAIPPVELYMDGFAYGVQYYNTQHKTTVQVIGWNTKTHQGLFAGGFTDTAKGQQITEQLISQGADIIFPLAGNVNNGAVAAVAQSGKGKVFVIWADTDGCVSDAQHCSLFLTSTEKHIAVAVQNAITQAAHGNFQAGNYVGTLANNGVGLAPYHDFANKIPDTLKNEINDLKQQIIDGKIKISSDYKPQTG